MNNLHSLKVLDVFQGLFRVLRIDYPVMRSIVALKLTMDSRRVPTIFTQSKQTDGNQFIKSLGLYALFGLATIPFLFIGDSAMLQMSLIVGISMFILMTSLISDFSAVLLDVRDRMILNTKPVSDRTINAAKLVHIGIYLIMLTGAFLGIPAVVILFKKGILFFLLFLVTVVFLLLLIIAITALVYMLILRFFDGERLKDIINYVQILLSVSLFAGYQILARSFDVMDLSITYQFHWWHVFIPPLWFGAPFELLQGGTDQNSLILLSCLAVLVPIVAILVYAKLMPAFEQNLQKLMGEARRQKEKRHMLRRIWERLLCRNDEERTFFRFSWNMMGQERQFKLKVYPSIGLGAIMPFFLLYSLNDAGYYALYFTHLITVSVVMMVGFSERFKGAWIYEVAPVEHKEYLHRAALKASLARLFLPIFIIQAIVFVVILGWQILPDILAILLAGLIVAAAGYRYGNRESLPFSKPINESQNSGTVMQFLYLFIVMAFVGVHALAAQLRYGVLVYMVLLGIGCYLYWKQSFRRAQWVEI